MFSVDCSIITHTHLLILDWDPLQSTDATRVQLAETMSLFWGYLDENGGGDSGAATTPRERHPQGPPNLGTCNTWPANCSTGWRFPFQLSRLV